MEITEKMYQRSKLIVEKYENQMRERKNHIPLMESSLSLRTVTRLMGEGFKTVGDVRKCFNENRYYGFRKIRGLGEVSIDEIRILLDMSHEMFYVY